LQVRDLEIVVLKDGKHQPVVNGISFDVRRNETVCLVGESGCGKSVTALAVMGLLQTPPVRIVGGEILLRHGGEVHDLTQLAPRGGAYRALRGAAVSMIFQEPMSSLNPVHRNGNQIAEVIQQHTGVGKREAWERMLDMLRLVGIPSPEVRARQYPHEISGGMRQRVMISMALACKPGMLLADEPTTALDVTTQAQILEEIRKLSRATGTSTLFITHDLGVVAQIADRVHVMYLGDIVESGDVRDIFRNPRHPYTRGLLASAMSIQSTPNTRLEPIRGTVQDLPEDRRGCPFGPRCDARHARCDTSTPPLFEPTQSHRAKCWLEEPRPT